MSFNSLPWSPSKRLCSGRYTNNILNLPSIRPFSLTTNVYWVSEEIGSQDVVNNSWMTYGSQNGRRPHYDSPYQTPRTLEWRTTAGGVVTDETGRRRWTMERILVEKTGKEGASRTGDTRQSPTGRTGRPPKYAPTSRCHGSPGWFPETTSPNRVWGRCHGS